MFVVNTPPNLYRQTMSMAGQTSGNMANSYAMSNGIPHTQTRLYTTSSAFGGASDKVLQVNILSNRIVAKFFEYPL